MDNARHSYEDVNRPGHVWTACSECDRGGNGTAKEKCSCGWLIKEYDKLGCWAGSPMFPVLKLAEGR